MNGTIDARVCGYKANYSSDWAFFYFFSSARVYIVIYFTRMCELRHWLLCKIMGWANRVWLLRALWVSGPVIVIGWRRRFLEFRLVDFFFPLYFFQQASWLKCLFCLTESGGSPCAHWRLFDGQKYQFRWERDRCVRRVLCVCVCECFRSQLHAHRIHNPLWFGTTFNMPRYYVRSTPFWMGSVFFFRCYFNFRFYLFAFFVFVLILFRCFHEMKKKIKEIVMFVLVST